MIKIAKVNQGKFKINYVVLAERFMKYVPYYKKIVKDENCVSILATRDAIKEMFEGSDVEVKADKESVTIQEYFNNTF